MQIIAYILIALFMTFWLAVCIAIRINWAREDKEARKGQKKNTSIYLRK